jgi:transcriptional regulator with XRE-family HTH domain
MRHNVAMKKRGENPPNNLRAWRLFRRMTQAELAEAVGTNANVIHLLENSERGLSHKWMLKLAPALGTTAGFMIDHDPHDLPSDLFDIWNRSTPAEQQQITSVAEALVPFRAQPRG